MFEEPPKVPELSCCKGGMPWPDELITRSWSIPLSCVRLKKSEYVFSMVWLDLRLRIRLAEPLFPLPLKLPDTELFPDSLCC